MVRMLHPLFKGIVENFVFLVISKAMRLESSA